MPLDAAVAGLTVGPRAVTVTARQTMAYAAALADLNPRYFDDTRPGGVVAPPLFGVRLDWPLRPLRPGVGGLTAAEVRRGVHATQDMVLHRLIRPGDRLTTRGRVVLVEPRSPGAYLVTRYDTVDATGAPMLTVWYGTILRGVACVGEARALEAPPPLPQKVKDAPGWTAEVPIPRWLPHVYTECADIWNPIHTERAVALAAGLPDIILHGTCTLALAARELVNREAGGDPARLARIACRFGAMVIPGTTVRVRVTGAAPWQGERAVFFTAENAEGGGAIRDGVAILRA